MPFCKSEINHIYKNIFSVLRAWRGKDHNGLYPCKNCRAKLDNISQKANEMAHALVSSVT